MKRLAIYSILLILTLLIPQTSRQHKPLVAIIPVSLQSTRRVHVGTSFVLASQLNTIVVAAPTLDSSVGSLNCGDNSYAQYVFSHESGCNTQALNAEGCYGLGQDCNGVVASLCGSDYTCQDNWFNNYAISRYGSWYNAMLFWESNSWW